MRQAQKADSISQICGYPPIRGGCTPLISANFRLASRYAGIEAGHSHPCDHRLHAHCLRYTGRALGGPDRVSTENALVAPGDQRCGEAAYSPLAPQDVEGEIYIMYTDAQAMDFYAVNLVVERPAVEIKKKDTPFMCAQSRSEGQKSVYDDGVVRYTTLRLADSPQYKEFTITVSDSEGAQGQCWRRR